MYQYIFLILFIVINFLFANSGQTIAFDKVNYTVQINETKYTPDEWIAKKHWDKMDNLTRVIYLKGYFDGWDGGNEYARSFYKSNDENWRKLYSYEKKLEQKNFLNRYEINKIINYIDEIYSDKKYKELPLSIIVKFIISAKNETEIYKNLDEYSVAFNEPEVEVPALYFDEKDKKWKQK